MGQTEKELAQNIRALVEEYMRNTGRTLDIELQYAESYVISKERTVLNLDRVIVNSSVVFTGAA